MRDFAEPLLEDFLKIPLCPTGQNFGNECPSLFEDVKRKISCRFAECDDAQMVCLFMSRTGSGHI